MDDGPGLRTVVFLKGCRLARSKQKLFGRPYAYADRQPLPDDSIREAIDILARNGLHAYAS